MTASLAQIDQIARDTVARLPAPFQAAAKGVVLQVVDLPPAEMLAELEIDEPLGLNWLYDGIPLTEKSVLGRRPTNLHRPAECVHPGGTAAQPPTLPKGGGYRPHPGSWAGLVALMAMLQVLRTVL